MSTSLRAGSPPNPTGIPVPTAPADPVKALLQHHRELCARAVDPLEIAAVLEARGAVDHTAAACRHRDLFSLAEELYARGRAVETAPTGPAGTGSALRGAPRSGGSPLGSLLRGGLLRGGLLLGDPPHGGAPRGAGEQLSPPRPAAEPEAATPFQDGAAGGLPYGRPGRGEAWDGGPPQGGSWRGVRPHGAASYGESWDGEVPHGGSWDGGLSHGGSWDGGLSHGGSSDGGPAHGGSWDGVPPYGGSWRGVPPHDRSPHGLPPRRDDTPAGPGARRPGPGLPQPLCPPSPPCHPPGTYRWRAARWLAGLWLVAYGLVGDRLLAALLAGRPVRELAGSAGLSGVLSAAVPTALALACAAASAAWSARWFTVRVRRALLGSRTLAEFRARVRPVPVLATAFHLAALAALLAAGHAALRGTVHPGPLTAVTALGGLLFVARLAASRGLGRAAAVAALAAGAAEATALLGALLAPDDGPLRPLTALAAAHGPAAVPLVACTAPAVALLACALPALTRASAHRSGVAAAAVGTPAAPHVSAAPADPAAPGEPHTPVRGASKMTVHPIRTAGREGGRDR
ncbi:hypothetical protein SMD11_2379 [Streptomyces albireticuli]|uniref:Integral membrane protein n=1 Tax=Streptomyces albireticuli TaxID=1940 RepID=A0A1Z2L169_9ACTN|nr:hypothetical protein SMD11_2379 [Streptomyces albireticuli]